MTAVAIHHELCAVYGQNVTSEGTVRQRCRMFKDMQISRPSAVSDKLVQNVDKKTPVKDSASQFQNFHVNFHKFHALLFTRLSQLG
jgi:hypothetical protein